jgi:hypothetical protein
VVRREPLVTVRGDVNKSTIMETSMEAPRELKIEPSQDPVTLHVLNVSHLSLPLFLHGSGQWVLWPSIVIALVHWCSV